MITTRGRLTLCSDLKRPQALIMSDPVDAEGVGGERGAAFATDFGARGEACCGRTGGSFGGTGAWREADEPGAGGHAGG